MSLIATCVEHSGVARIFFDLRPAEPLSGGGTTHRDGDRTRLGIGGHGERNGGEYPSNVIDRRVAPSTHRGEQAVADMRHVSRAEIRMDRQSKNALRQVL